MLRSILLAPLLFLIPVAVAAECGGTDLMEQLRQSDPAAHAAILENGSEVPNGQGKFWRVERDGVEPSYLFGTFHDTGLGAEDLPPAVGKAMTGARLMLVELTEAEEAQMQARIATDPGFILAPDGNGLIDQLSAAEQGIAGPRLAARGLTLPIAAQLRPWMLFTVLAIPVCVIQDAQLGKPLLDKAMAAAAAEAGVPIEGLETHEQALGSLMKLPPEVMEALILDMLRQPADDEDVWRTSSNLYRAGEIATIWEYSRAEAIKTIGPERGAEVFEIFGEHLLVARNAAWLAVLEPALAAGNVFAAFGAMHLVDETGIVELLRARGYTVTRLDG